MTLLRSLDPRVRRWIYAGLAALTAGYAVAYLILAVVNPVAAQRLLDALPALLGALSLSGLGHVLALANVPAGRDDQP